MSLNSRFGIELFNRVIAALSGSLLVILLARLLTPEGYGLLFLSISIFSIIGLFSKLGVAKSAARYITEYREKDPDQIPYIIKTSFKYNLILIIVVSLALLATHDQIPVIIGEEKLTPFLLVGVLFIIFSSLFVFARLTLQGFEEIRLSATTQILESFTRPLFALGFVFLGFGAIGALSGYIIGYFSASMLGLWFVYTRMYKIRDSSHPIEEDLARRIREYAVPLTATDTASMLDKQLDTFIVGFLLNPVAVSYYVVGKQIVILIATPMRALGFTLSPTLSAQKVAGDLEHAARAFENALIHCLLVYVPAALGLIIVADPTIELVFGSEYSNAVPVVQVMALYSVLWSVTRLTSELLDFVGQARTHAIVKGITAIMNVVLTIILVLEFGVVGAAIATVITYSIYTISNLYLINIEFPMRITYVIQSFVKIVAIAAVMAAIVYIISGIITDIATLFLVIFIGVIIWSTLSIIGGFLDLQQIIQNLHKR